MNPSDSDSNSSSGNSGVIIADPTVEDKSKVHTSEPPVYKVLLLNDDYTPMDFVIHILQAFFQKNYTEASEIMLQVHTRGAGVAGTYTREIAETKVFQVNQYAKQRKYPLKCTMEKA